MATKIKAARTPVTGRIVAPTTGDDYGELSVNIADRKLFIRDAAGVSRLIAQGIANYSAALIYAVGDLAIESNKLYLCSVAVPVPEPFDPANWTLLGGGGTTDGSVILAPAAAGRNRIVPAAAAAEGILIDAPSTQTADLLAIPGTALSDTGVWAVDAQGFSNQRVGAVVWRQAEPTHNFSFRGQPAAFDGARWVPADADEPLGTALALVQEIIDANTLVLRAGGRITNLQTGAFAGGTIAPATAYYVSSAVPGQLTPVEPTTGRRDPVLTTISATAGVVSTGSSRNLVEAPPPTVVGPTAPPAPELGDLWYRTTAPIGLYVWRDDVSIGEWVPATLPVPAVIVSDVAPSTPDAGQLWFRTVDPVGLFIWYTDTDSSQWVQIGGGGLPSFASTAEAQAGVATDKVMSPALVRARQGFQSLSAAGLTTLTFPGIAEEATEIDLTLDFMTTATVVTSVKATFDGLVGSYASEYQFFGAAYVAPVTYANADAILIPAQAVAQTITGNLRMTKRVVRWYAEGLFRINNTLQVQVRAHTPIMSANPTALTLTFPEAISNGFAGLKWRI